MDAEVTIDGVEREFGHCTCYTKHNRHRYVFDYKPLSRRNTKENCTARRTVDDSAIATGLNGLPSWIVRVAHEHDLVRCDACRRLHRPIRELDPAVC